MPFIKPERRAEITRLGFVACKDVGDLCYVFYKEMVHKWNESPRWTTAHGLYRQTLDDESEFFWTFLETVSFRFDPLDLKAAQQLAWQVFFIRFVMPYENMKIMENGDIT